MRNRGLAFKLSVLIVTGGVAVLGLLFGYNYRVVREIVVKNAGDNARAVTLTTVNRVETALTSTEKVPQNLADFLGHSTYTEAELLKLLRAVVKNNREIYGATVAFEPHAFDPGAVYFAPYAHRRNDKIEVRRLGGDTYRYFAADWYQIPKETDHAVWSEPYFDEGGGNIVMSTYSVPFYGVSDGTRRFLGVVTADVSLDWLASIVSSVRLSQRGYAFIISRNGMLVTHPMRSLVMNETLFGLAEARDDPNLRQIGRAMIHGDAGFVPTACIGLPGQCWLVYAPVPANGWSVGAMFPEADLLADVTNLNRSMLSLAGLGSLFLLIVVVAVARSITGPLTGLTRASEALARGDLDSSLPAVTSGDEVGRLAAAFARMQRDLKRYIEDLRETSAARERVAAQLEEYSRTLEQKVTERTHELQDKNVALESTLTQLKSTQEQLIVQEKLASLGALTAGIAHEIKNPLNFVTNFAQLSTELTQELRTELDAHAAGMDAKTRDYIAELLGDLEQNVAKINEHGKRADSIVRGMLQHSRGQSGDFQPTDLNALLQEHVALAYHGMRAQDATFNVTLEADYDPAVGQLRIVPQDIGRVFLNIVNNACYAVHEKQRRVGSTFTPTVSVRSQDLGDRVEVRIRDNGDGIPRAVRDKLFNPFFTTKPAGKGTGLGLSISHDIVVQQHHGELRVDSQAGEYAEFVIVLPRQLP